MTNETPQEAEPVAVTEKLNTFFRDNGIDLNSEVAISFKKIILEEKIPFRKLQQLCDSVNNMLIDHGKIFSFSNIVVYLNLLIGNKLEINFKVLERWKEEILKRIRNLEKKYPQERIPNDVYAYVKQYLGLVNTDVLFNQLERDVVL